MSELFLTFVNMSLTASYVIVFVILVRFLLKKAPKIISYALWAIVGIRLLVPFSFESVLSIFPKGVSTTPIPTDIIYQANPQISSGIGPVDTIINDSLPAATPIASANPLQLSVSIFADLWLVGITVLLAYSLISLIKLWRQLKSAELVADNIYLAEGLQTPFVLGLVRPKIYLPSGLSEEEKSYVLLHEQVHIKRKDHIIKVLAFLITILHWFNPLVWIAFVLMNKDMEQACDEKVLKLLSGENIKKPYASTLLAFANHKRTFSGSPLAFSEGNLKGRIKNILDYRKPTVWVVGVSILVLIIASITFLANPVDDPNDKDAASLLRTGKYIMQDTEFINEAWLTIKKDGEYEFMLNLLSSYFPRGTYEVKGKELILYVDEEETYKFTIEADKLIFDSSSSVISQNIVRGSVFKLSVDDPEGLGPDSPPALEVDEDHVIVYGGPYLNSEQLTSVHVDSLKVRLEEMTDFVYEFIDGKLILWEETALAEDQIGYYIGKYRSTATYPDYRYTITLRFRNGEERVFNELADGQRYIVYSDVAQHGYFTLATLVDNSIRYQTLIDSRTGKEHQTAPYFVHSPYNNRIFATDSGYHVKGDNKIEILNFVNNEVVSEWVVEFFDFGVQYMEWIDKDSFKFTRLTAVNNSWEQVYSPYRMVNEELNYKNGEWTRTSADSYLGNENVKIYDSIGKEAKLIGNMNEADLTDAVAFTDIYQIINGQVVLWFEMETASGDKGYIYRGLRDGERPYYDNQSGREFTFIMENGEYLTIKDHLSNAYDYFVQDYLGDIGYYSLYQTYDGEGYGGRFINSRTGGSQTGAGFPTLSKTKERFIIANMDLQAGYSWNGIEIYKVNKNDFTREYREGFESWGPKDVIWVNDEHILFTKHHVNYEGGTWTETAAELVLANGKWIMRDID